MSPISKVESTRKKPSARELTKCRACDRSRLEEVLDLGQMPLAGDFRPAGQINRLYPLAVDYCPHCGVLQVREEVPHEVIFSPTYSYASSTIPGLVRHFGSYAREVALGPRSRPKRLLEIGCNDGVFLKPLAECGYEVVGVDASQNVVRKAQAKGLNVTLGKFGKTLASQIASDHGIFDVVTCSNVFAHNPALRDFMEGVSLLLERTRGEFWVEVHSARALYEGLQWDCFYHEHCFYWSIHSLQKCLREFGFHLRRFKTTSMHGGAIRAVFSREKKSEKLLEPEITEHEWMAFGAKCRRSRVMLRDSIARLGIRYAYGAAGRAVTLINWAELAPHLEFVVDGSPLRYNKVIPNTSVPIISEAEYSQRKDISGWCFVTAHNYLSDIRAKVESFFPGKSTGFVTPLPHVTIQ